MTPNRAPSPRAVELVRQIHETTFSSDRRGIAANEALLAYIADLEARAEAPKGEAVAWEHTLHMDLGQTETRLTDEADDEPFGRWNVDYDPFYRVTKRPLIYGDTAPPSPKAEPNQGALAAIDKLMHAWVMGERWVRLDDVKAALATQATATQETK